MFQRDVYLKELINKKQNHLVKVITGIRRCGKSYLLNEIFYNYLIEKENVPNDHIIKFAFDNEEDISLLDKYLSDQPTVIEKNNQKISETKRWIFEKKQNLQTFSQTHQDKKRAQINKISRERHYNRHHRNYY